MSHDDERDPRRREDLPVPDDDVTPDDALRDDATQAESVRDDASSDAPREDTMKDEAGQDDAGQDDASPDDAAQAEETPAPEETQQADEEQPADGSRDDKVPGEQQARAEQQAGEDASVAVPTPRRRRAGRGRAALAVGSGALLVLATAAVAVAPRWVPDVERSGLAVPAARTAAGSSTFVCPPAPQRVGQDAGSDQAYAPGAATASSSISAASLGDQAMRLPGTALLGAQGRVVKRLAPELSEDKAAQSSGRADDGYSGVKGVAGTKLSSDDAAWLRVQALGGLRVPGAATRTVDQRSGDLSGLAAPSCQSPANTVWLTGASTTVGHTAVLNITNPAATSAAISVTVMTGDGVSTDGAIQPFTLGAGETRSLNLGGTAKDAGEIAVKVQSSGAAVSASVNQTVLRGTTAAGLDVITAAGSPSATQVMTGVRLQDAAVSKKVGNTDAVGDETPQVQIADLSGEGTTADVVARDADGKDHRVTSGISVPASSVVAVPLDSLPAGTYTLRVEAKDVVAATTRLLRGTDPAKTSDVTYVPATDQISTSELVAVPSAGDATLTLAAPDQAAEVTVVPIAADGKQGAAKKVSIAAGGTSDLQLSDLKNPVALQLSASGTAYGSLLSTQGDSGMASTALPQAPQPPASSRVDLAP